jgi:hypothetical protein
MIAPQRVIEPVEIMWAHGRTPRLIEPVEITPADAQSQRATQTCTLATQAW